MTTTLRNHNFEMNHSVSEPSAKKAVQKILEPSGVRISGNRPWDIQVHNSDFYERVLAEGSIALGESYMDGWWDCQALDQFFERILEKKLDRSTRRLSMRLTWSLIKAKLINLQKRSRAHIVGERHYDLGNDLFAAMLDDWMNYSCGYWENAESLTAAQTAKMDLICRKIELNPGMRVLDVGCGWGGFAKYAAQKYGAYVHGITVSREQADFAKKFCRAVDVKIDLMDYRELTERYDRIVSIGMFEHVGEKNYRTFFKVIQRSLKKGGLFLLHTIAKNTSTGELDPWISKYIFPNSSLPSARQITSAFEGLFVLEDWHSFGQYYDTTLMAWQQNFRESWPELRDRYGRRFYRMWSYFLLSCAGSFRSRRNQLWQIVLSQKGVKGGYRYCNRLDT